MPPKCHFVSAGSPAIAAEMTQMQRMARLLPPPCNLQLQDTRFKLQVRSIGGGGGSGLPFVFEIQDVPSVIANRFISSSILEHKFIHCQWDSVRVFKLKRRKYIFMIWDSIRANCCAA